MPDLRQQCFDPDLAVLEAGVSPMPLRRSTDERGTLLPLEWDDLPFVPSRIFTVSGAAAGTVRGGHGHRTCSQLLVAVAGQIEVEVVRADARRTFTLTPQSPGLLVRPGIWFAQTYISPASVLLVLASEPYDASGMFHSPSAK